VMVLCRASSSLLLFAVPLFCLWKLRSWRIFLLTLVGAASVVGPWLIKAQDLAGEFLWINGSNNLNLYYGNSEFTPEYRTWWIGSHGGLGLADSARFVRIQDSVQRLSRHDENEFYRKSATEYIIAHPTSFLLRTFNRVGSYLAFDSFTASYIKNLGASKFLLLLTLAFDGAIYLALVLLAVAFLVFYWKEIWRTPIYLLILLCGILYAGPYWISFASPVYHTPLLPLVLIFAMLFLARTSRSTRALNSSRQKLIYGLLAAYVIFAQVQFIFNMTDRL
jgi:hypothetical protein